MSSIFCNSQGMVMIDYLEQGRIINGAYYAYELMQLHQEILSRRIEAATPGKMLTIRRTTISLFVLSGNLILSRCDLFIWYSFQSKNHYPCNSVCRMCIYCKAYFSIDRFCLNNFNLTIKYINGYLFCLPV